MDTGPIFRIVFRLKIVWIANIFAMDTGWDLRLGFWVLRLGFWVLRSIRCQQKHVAKRLVTITLIYPIVGQSPPLFH